jgi:hypothetical protein
LPIKETRKGKKVKQIHAISFKNHHNIPTHTHEKTCLQNTAYQRTGFAVRREEKASQKNITIPNSCQFSILVFVDV